jgi:hypothetical protein
MDPYEGELAKLKHLENIVTPVKSYIFVLEASKHLYFEEIYDYLKFIST